MLSHLLLFAEFSGLYPIILLESVQTGISHDEGQRFPHTEFTMCSSWSHKFAVWTNRELLGLKVIVTLYIGNITHAKFR